MKAIITGNAYKYWTYGGSDLRLHVFDHDGDTVLSCEGGMAVRPNDICEDITYAAQAFSILGCCGTGSVELHYYLEDYDDVDFDVVQFIASSSGCEYRLDTDSHTATFIPSIGISREKFAYLMMELYDVAAFEVWDDDVNTGTVDFDLV